MLCLGANVSPVFLSRSVPQHRLKLFSYDKIRVAQPIVLGYNFTGVWSKFVLKKIKKKHERLSMMESNVLGRINKTLNESFKDEQLDLQAQMLLLPESHLHF